MNRKKKKTSNTTVSKSYQVPEELESVWDDEIAADFKELNPNQQAFIIAFIGPSKGNAADAYRRGYNRPLISPESAGGLASSVMRSHQIGRILEKFAGTKTEALFTVVNGYREMAQACKPNWVKDEHGQYENAGDDPDWQARNWAFSGLRGVYGLDVTRDSTTAVNNNIIVQVNLPSRGPVG
jgi:hypothetical protein